MITNFGSCGCNGNGLLGNGFDCIGELINLIVTVTVIESVLGVLVGGCGCNNGCGCNGSNGCPTIL